MTNITTQYTQIEKHEMIFKIIDDIYNIAHTMQQYWGIHAYNENLGISNIRATKANIRAVHRLARKAMKLVRMFKYNPNIQILCKCDLCKERYKDRDPSLLELLKTIWEETSAQSELMKHTDLKEWEVHNMTWIDGAFVQIGSWLHIYYLTHVIKKWGERGN